MIHRVKYFYEKQQQQLLLLSWLPIIILHIIIIRRGERVLSISDVYSVYVLYYDMYSCIPILLFIRHRVDVTETKLFNKILFDKTC